MSDALQGKDREARGSADDQFIEAVRAGLMDVSIPALDELIERGSALNHCWTAREEGILRKYYGKVTVPELQRLAFPDRTRPSIALKAQRMGLT